MDNKDGYRESNWQECLFNKTARKVFPDKSRATFLIKTSAERAKYLQTVSITEQSANFIFESYYSSLIELLQAISALEGYNILNHLCLGFYLRDILKEEALFRAFDFCRFKRNKLIYYGNMMEFEIAKDALMQIKKLIEDLRLLIKSKYGIK